LNWNVILAGESVYDLEGEATQGEECHINCRETAKTRLEEVAGADNPYSLIMIFG
jgi:hypothetical protein